MIGWLGRWVAALARRGTNAERAQRAERRSELRAAPLPEGWRAIVERELPQYARLTAAQREKLLDDAKVFAAEKIWYGEDGFVIDDRVKVLVSASAALLALGGDIAMFDHVERVVIREAVVVEDSGHVGGRYEATRMMIGDRVVDHSGVVELSWSAVIGGLARADGQHTAIHEFAHAFDHADGRLDALVAHPSFDRWRAALHELPLGRRILGSYLATEVIGDVDGPELFASATELFFECPHRLRSIDSELFDVLCAMYAIDPRTFATR